MYKTFLINYLNKLDKEDIYNYGLNNSITLNKDEIDIIYNYLKKRYNDIINHPIDILNEIKDKVNDNTYKFLLSLYDKYQDKLVLFK